MNNIPTVREKCTGALLASAIGDALGWPYEFRSRNNARNFSVGGDFFIDWTRKCGGQYWNHDELILAGEYSDDTQMILAVSRSIISGTDWIEHLSFKELPYWLKYERGGGNALKQAAKIYKSRQIPWETDFATNYFNAGGNGSAMRIIPHIIVNIKSSNTDKIMDDVFLNCIITHGHPRAILGATCYAFALDSILRKTSVLQFGELIRIIINGSKVWGKYRGEIAPYSWKTAKENLLSFNYDEEWHKCLDDMLDKLVYIEGALKKGLLVNDSEILKFLKCFDKENGAGDVAALAAIYLASKYANNPILGIKTAAYTIGIDTDTIASMVGGLLGMLCGTAWIPAEWRIVQDYKCIYNISDILLSEDIKSFSKHISDINCANHELQNSPIGKIYIDSIQEISSGRTGRIIITKVCTSLGQSFYIKQYKRLPDKDKLIKSSSLATTDSGTKNFRKKTTTLNIDKAQEIIKDSKFNRITFKKVIQIIDELLYYNDCEYVASLTKTKVDIVEKINELLQ